MEMQRKAKLTAWRSGRTEPHVAEVGWEGGDRDQSGAGGAQAGA